MTVEQDQLLYYVYYDYRMPSVGMGYITGVVIEDKEMSFIMEGRYKCLMANIFYEPQGAYDTYRELRENRL